MKKNNVGAGLVSAHAITLITLVITIVILIILASITINLALSDSGLFSKTKQASTQYDIASTREKIETAVLTSQISGNYDASVDTSLLETELINTCGITASDITKSDATGSLPWTVNANGYVFTISATGAVTVSSSISDDSEEVEPEPTDIYVALDYWGTLTFYSSNVTIEEDMENERIWKNYGNIKGNSYSSFSGVPWHNDWGEITKIKFADEIYPTSTAYWFYYLTEVNTIENIENLKTNLVTDMSYMFNQFAFDSETLTSLDLSSFDTHNVMNMEGMFGATQFTSIDVSSFDTSNVTNMSSMFVITKVESLDLSNFDTSNVTNMREMFCEMISIESLDLSSFDTHNVTNMRCMFSSVSQLNSITVSRSKWSMGQADTTYMFDNCGVVDAEHLTYVD
jgi:surface protein